MERNCTARRERIVLQRRGGTSPGLMHVVTCSVSFSLTHIHTAVRISVSPLFDMNAFSCSEVCHDFQRTLDIPMGTHIHTNACEHLILFTVLKTWLS